MTCCFQIASNSPCLKGLTRISPLCPIRVNRCLVTVGAIRTILASEDETRSLACNDGTAFDRSRLKLDATEAAVKTSGRPLVCHRHEGDHREAAETTAHSKSTETTTYRSGKQ
mmetsp:Transcript_49803/g.74273  ORF Transcript_49803/g.74273 Transcript_49803/m.74273 type:complete len:113 (+) Transcript_49803:165-503(+)